ncbi:hypothetical protein [Prosthecomicrobium sp. N25]|uniref:hypothetical protein n=1 Tax=Prosthecomicrobium sp. N25 TaxID=3129254 RepID=UPI0030786FB4
MTMNFLRGGLAATALGATLLLTPAAHAQSARDTVVSAVVEALKAAGAKTVTYGSVTGDDAKFTLKDIKAEIEMEGRSSEMTAASATYTNAAPAAGGGYTVGQIDIADLAIEDDQTTISVDSWKITNYVGQGPAKVAATKGFGDRFGRMELTGIEIENEGEAKVPIYSVVVDTSGHVDGIPRKMSTEVKGLVIPIDAAKPEARDIAALGYKEIAVDVTASGAWDEQAQRLSVDNLTINGKDIGALKIALAFGGVSAEAVKALQAAADDSTKQMEILQGFSVEGLTIRFDNASIVDRVLDQQAKAQGTKREQYVTGIAAAVPLMISAIGNKDFEKKVSDAVSAFLKTPKSLTVTAKPAQPVPVAQIVGTALVAPQTIPNVLAVDIQANK